MPQNIFEITEYQKHEYYTYEYVTFMFRNKRKEINHFLNYTIWRNCPHVEISCPEASMLVLMGNPAYKNIVILLSRYLAF